MKRLKLMLFLFGLSLLLFQLQAGFGQTSQFIPGKFRHERTIVPGGSGPNRLHIDTALLAGGSPFRQFTQHMTGSAREPMIIATGGLKDLRIYDSSNREIPYLLILPPTPEPKWIAGQLAPLALTKRASGFQVDLGRSLMMDHLQLSGIPAPFVKRCTLEASNDGSYWTWLRSDATVFDLPAEKLRSLEIEFNQGEYRYLKVTWDDSASARVPIPRSASVRLVSGGSLPPRLEAPLQFERRGSEPGVSRYRLRLPGGRLPITSIKLSVAGGNVLREARITESRLAGDEMVPNILGTATLRREVRGDLSAAEMSVAIEAPQEAQLDLVVEDANNPPLDITGITATYAFLPWIYFESADAKPLTARYGQPNLKEPRYDLEAARLSAAKAHTIEAKWEKELPLKVEAESPAHEDVPVIGAAIDLSSFKYARSISPGKPGLSALPLDAAVLAHSRISDLRIAGADEKQVPYLIEKADEPLSLDLPALKAIEAPGSGPFRKQNTKDTRSYYRMLLPYQDLPAARLILTTSARIFQREIFIVIERSPQNDRQEAWSESIATSLWRHTDPETAAPALTVNIPSLKTAEAMVVVEEGDNSPLPITSLKLLLPAHRLRFFRSNASDLKLYYGRNDLDAPRYDLAILAPRLVGATAEEVQMSPESDAAQVQTRPLPQKLFWGILIAAVLILLVLIGRLVRKT
jgi:hypothetical protein